MTIKPSLVIYHGNCADGFTSAWAIWKKYPQYAEEPQDIIFHPGVYGKEPPDCTGHDVYLVDFCYKLPVMEKIIAQAKSVTVLDHHKSAQEDIEPLLKEGKINGIFDMSRSGARITWDWFHPGEVPPHLLNIVQDRDLWTFKFPETENVQAALFSYHYDFAMWNHLMMDLDWRTLEAEGISITRKHHKDIAELCEVSKRLMKIGGKTVWVANLPYTLCSDACHLLAKTPLKIPGGQEIGFFGASYFDTPSGRVFSLRSIGDFDVSAVAKAYGGGGHKNAAGFTMPIGWEGDA